jgi:hypothetical protein
MAADPRPLPPATTRTIRRKPVEMTALLSPRRLTDGELQRVSRVLAAEGFGDIRPASITFTPDDAKAVAAGDGGPVPASLAWGIPPPPPSDPNTTLRDALAAARSHGGRGEGRLCPIRRC